MRFPFDNVDNDDMEQTPSQTEHSGERGPTAKAGNPNLGHSDELDDDDVGDIADEGTGRRG
jgi:hypothetical protein